VKTQFLVHTKRNPSPLDRPTTWRCSKKAWFRIKGLPSPDRKYSDFVSLNVITIWKKGSCYGQLLTDGFLSLYAERLNKS